MRNETQQELERYLEARPDTQGFEILLPDINGILRGIRVPRDDMPGIVDPGAYMSASTMLLDSRGVLPDGLDIGLRDGDPDFACRPVPGSFAPVPWAGRPTGQCLAQMFADGAQPYHYDSRYVLQRVLQRYADSGLVPVIALELEFYLLDDTRGGRPAPLRTRIPGTDLLQESPRLHGLDDLHAFEEFLADVEAACVAQRLPIGSTMSEGAPGQLEINLRHVPDAVLACDHAILLRRLIRGVARRHGMAATFMAKPFADLDGSGMHIHMSLNDNVGRNVFAGRPDASRPDAYAPVLRHAIGGLLDAIPQTMAILAPNANSYRRLGPSSFLSIRAAWGANHRRVAVRIPPSDDANVRFEYRPAGADSNPYLVSAAVLAAVHDGMTRRVEPPSMVGEGQIIDEDASAGMHWERALDLFERGDMLRACLGDAFCETYLRCRRLEAAEYRSQVPDLDYLWYLANI